MENDANGRADDGSREGAGRQIPGNYGKEEGNVAQRTLGVYCPQRSKEVVLGLCCL